MGLMNIQNLSQLKIKSIVTRYTALCQGASYISQLLLTAGG